MAASNNFHLKNRKRGVLLTLGITFLALVVLTLASLILRNAETSEERLVELAGIDRLYNLGSSLERSLARSLKPITDINLEVTENTIKVGRQMSGSFPDPTLVSISPSGASTTGFDYKLMTCCILSTYYPLVSREVTFFTELDANLLGINRVALQLEPSKMQYWLTAIPFNITDHLYHPFTVNNESDDGIAYNSTYHWFLAADALNSKDFSIVDNVSIYVRHATRNPIINWSDNGKGRLRTSGLQKENVLVNITAEGPNGWLVSEIHDVWINNTPEVFPAVIYIDNLTGEQGTEDERRKPTMRVLRGNTTVTDPTTGNEIKTSLTSVFVINYAVPLYAEIFVSMNTTFTEVYSTQLITTQLPAFKMIRSRLARYV